MAEFSGAGDREDGMPVHSASEDLALQKANDAARRNREEKAEADLETRVADVVHAVKNSLHAGTSRDIDVPLAVHPNNAKNDGIQGNDRDDNFIQFQNDASISGGFLSSLVMNHKKEERMEMISHKSRKLMNQRKLVTSSRAFSIGSSVSGVVSKSRRQLEKSSNPNHLVGKIAVAKKPRKSKY